MLRSLLAVLVAVLVGLTAAKFLEGGIAALFGIEGVISREASLTTAYQLNLLFSWLTASLIAATIAVLIGRKWAPLGWVASLTILFNAVMTMSAASVSWWAWIIAPLATLGGGFAAIRLLKAQSSPVENSMAARFLE
jgi:hypothetical protein